VNALWALAQWFADEPSRVAGCFCLVVVVGIFGGYATRKRGRHRG
jgi:hypothetical protein